MEKSSLVLPFVGVFILFNAAIQASIIEYPLDNPVQYVREIGPMQVSHSSPVDIYVANVLNEQRWKDWKIIIWVPLADPDLTQMQVDYDNTPDHSNPLEIFTVPLASYTGPINLGPDWKGFYADTWEQPWQQYGTNPVGSGLEHTWGNPAWVSFHFDVGVDPFIYIKDACIPEPATIALLAIGGLLVRFKAH